MYIILLRKNVYFDISIYKFDSLSTHTHTQIHKHYPSAETDERNKENKNNPYCINNYKYCTTIIIKPNNMLFILHKVSQP